MYKQKKNNLDVENSLSNYVLTTEYIAVILHNCVVWVNGMLSWSCGVMYLAQN